VVELEGSQAGELSRGREGPTETEAAALPAAAIVAVNQGRMIEAIRIVREGEPGLGLAAARARVEAHVARDPMLKAQLEQKMKEARGRLVRWVLVIDVLLVAAVVWYLFGR
jgi:hypothetical protein